MLFFILKIFINILIIGLFLYGKLVPHKDKLIHPFKGYFEFFEKIFLPIFVLIKTKVKPFQVGVGLAVDMTQIFVLIILLLINYII